MPNLTITQILSWADDYHLQTGEWPNIHSGAIHGTGENWMAVHMALYRGHRGLAKSSLAALLAKERDDINRTSKSFPGLDQILKWADEHHSRTGKWPTARSGAITDSGGQHWMLIDRELRSRGTSLRSFLVSKRGLAPYKKARITVTQILSWADEHRDRTGQWPTQASGKVQAAPHETWWQIDRFLADGRRGLKGGSSLAKLLAKKRGRPFGTRLPQLSVEQIREWARAYKSKHGRWPDRKSGDIDGVLGETWLAVWIAMQQGTRGLKRWVETGEVFSE